MADRILGKRRELELYLNVVEWGPGGVYGIEQGARYHYHVSAARLDREQAARLAAILPAPRRWHPARMDDYSAVILARMEKAGW
jgi:monofunctional biosynthetic peptidoglycan transglycosylase